LNIGILAKQQGHANAAASQQNIEHAKNLYQMRMLSKENKRHMRRSHQLSPIQAHLKDPQNQLFLPPHKDEITDAI